MGNCYAFSKSDNPDLFWAIRGGGGNFGVVSSFEYRLHQLGPKVLAGDLAYAPAQTRDALEQYAHFAASAPRELSAEFSWGGTEGPDGDLTLSVCFIGDPKDGAERCCSRAHRREARAGQHPIAGLRGGAAPVRRPDRYRARTSI